MTALEILKGVRELLTDPAHWTKGVTARNKRHQPVLALSKGATCWCWVGATERVAGKHAETNDWRAISALADTLGVSRAFDITTWQDAPERTHAEVLDATDRTIARLESQP